MDVHVYTGTLRPKQSCQIRVVNKSNETPTEFQREEVRAKQWRDKMTEGGGQAGMEDGRSGHGGLYVLVKVALRNKSCFECAPTQKRD